MLLYLTMIRLTALENSISSNPTFSIYHSIKYSYVRQRPARRIPSTLLRISLVHCQGSIPHGPAIKASRSIIFIQLHH